MTMKAVITGHKRGIGKAIAEYFITKKYHVVGFSKTDGYDISNTFDREFIRMECRTADIFVNNAYNNDYSQNILLTEILATPGQVALIINISSNAKPHTKYGILKKELNDICQSYAGPVHILNLRPGYVDTDRVRNVRHSKMTTENVINILDFCLNSKLKITEIEFGVK